MTSTPDAERDGGRGAGRRAERSAPLALRDLLILEVAALVVLVVWMRVNAAAATGGFPFANGGLFFQEPRPPTPAEVATHARLAWSAVAAVVIVGLLAARRRRWGWLALHAAALPGVLRVAAALAP